ncbi:MAG: hypothetical protein J6Q84_02710 [Kiritimatiellae bacterium]|nr:hypothetical protein [Kiritimatiellia bacterium]
MDKEVAAEKAKKIGGILLVVLTKTFKVMWVCVKWIFKALWWIIKNFKFKTTSMN